MPVYVAAKYVGVLLSVLMPMFLLVFVTGTVLVAKGLAPLSFLWPLLLAFLSIAVPAHAFVVAFSLACPLVMPLRVYQVLFTGYWFWGNLLTPKAFPTISDTVLNAVGQYLLQAFFAIYTDSTHKVEGGFTPPEAVLNLIVLIACIAVALFVLYRYLRWQERRARSLVRAVIVLGRRRHQHVERSGHRGMQFLGAAAQQPRELWRELLFGMGVGREKELTPWPLKDTAIRTAR